MALLGLLATAGYQNRDKMTEMLGNAGKAAIAPDSAGGHGVHTGRVFGGAGRAGAGGFLTSGLGEMLSHFAQAGHGETASSWVNHGSTRELPAPALEHAIGRDVTKTLAERTGLSRDELLPA